MASADERETRGFISITTMSPSFGLTANCTFDPPVSTPIARMIAIAWSRSSWYLSSDKRLLRGDRDRVAGVHAHRVDVLDRGDDHDVVVLVAHDLELELAPAEQRLLDERLADRTRRERGAEHRRSSSREYAMPPPKPPIV